MCVLCKWCIWQLCQVGPCTLGLCAVKTEPQYNISTDFRNWIFYHTLMKGQLLKYTNVTLRLLQNTCGIESGHEYIIFFRILCSDFNFSDESLAEIKVTYN